MSKFAGRALFQVFLFMPVYAESLGEFGHFKGTGVFEMVSMISSGLT
jgi:hypothetical protein